MKTVTKTEAQNMLDAGRISSSYFKKKYTILMPKEAAQNWLDALRSGEYIQSAMVLHNPTTGGFCCLGVEQYCNNDGYVENNYKSDKDKNGNFLGYPTIGYQQERGYLFVDADNCKTGNPALRKGRTANLNDSTYEVKKKVNQYATKKVKLHTNDFAKMADYLEEVMLVY
ncbi:hypothetical protein [Stenotrophomonas phage RAS14]